MKTVCPNCNAEDTLYQEVRVEFSTTRHVKAELEEGKAKASYGWRCPRSLYRRSEKDLLGEKPHEHRSDACDWWGFNPWQHGLERPDCGGVVRDRDALEAVA